MSYVQFMPTCMWLGKLSVFTMISCCRQAAEAGDAEAQAQLGHMYASGLGVEANNQSAIKWFRRGSDGGSASAKFGLGFMYLYGHSLHKDYRTALKYLSAAADQVMPGLCLPCAAHLCHPASTMFRKR